MKRDKIIELTEEYLKSVPDLKKRIRLIDVSLKERTYDISTVEKLKLERKRLYFKLSRIVRAISTLSDENQRIICYKYFDNLTFAEIGRRVGCRSDTASRRSRKLLLDIARILYGFEDEFWREIYMIDY